MRQSSGRRNLPPMPWPWRSAAARSQLHLQLPLHVHQQLPPQPCSAVMPVLRCGPVCY